MSDSNDKPTSGGDELADIFGQASDDAGAFQVWEGDEGDEGDGDSGLEIDDAQADEIRSIFLTTLPQYLEPVEQMLDQVFDGDGDSAETRQAVVATLSSLDAAAARIGLDEIVDQLKRLADRVLLLEDGADDRARARRAIVADLTELRRLTGAEDRPAGGGAEDGGQTIIAALDAAGGVEGVDEAALARLTSAGLLTVDQLLMAQPDEVVVVSGLDPAVVDRLLGAVARGGTPAAGPPSNVVELSVDSGSLRAHLERKRRKQAEAEALLAETRAEVQRLRRRLPELRADLAAAEDRREELRDALARVRSRIAESSRELDEALAARRELTGRHAATEEAVIAREKRVLRLRRERDAAIAERTELEREVAGLVERVQRMLENTVRG